MVITPQNFCAHVRQGSLDREFFPLVLCILSQFPAILLELSMFILARVLRHYFGLLCHIKAVCENMYSYSIEY